MIHIHTSNEVLLLHHELFLCPYGQSVLLLVIIKQTVTALPHDNVMFLRKYDGIKNHTHRGSNDRFTENISPLTFCSCIVGWFLINGFTH